MRIRIALGMVLVSLAFAGGIKDAVKRHIEEGKEHLQDVNEAAEEAEGNPPPLPVEPTLLVACLGDPSVERRDAAEKALEGMGGRAERALKDGASSKDAEVARRSRILLERLASARRDAALKSVALLAALEPGEHRCGQPLRLTAGMRNGGTAPVVLLRSRISVELKDASGTPVPVELPSGETAPLQPSDFLTLEPGQSATVLEGSPAGSVPPAPGRYTLVLVYRAADPLPCSPEAVALLERLPRGEVRSEPVPVEVTK